MHGIYNLFCRYLGRIWLPANQDNRSTHWVPHKCHRHSGSYTELYKNSHMHDNFFTRESDKYLLYRKPRQQNPLLCTMDYSNLIPRLYLVLSLALKLTRGPQNKAMQQDKYSTLGLPQPLITSYIATYTYIQHTYTDTEFISACRYSLKMQDF